MLLPTTVQEQVHYAMGIIAIGTYAMRSMDDVAQVAATSNATPIPADLSRFPQIDFAQSILLGVSYGFGGSCWSAEFVSATLDGDTLTVAHREVRYPGASGIACFGTVPHTRFATVARGAARVVFELLPVRIVQL